MNDNLIADLKQFIQGAVTQASLDIREELGARIDGLDATVVSLDAKIESVRTELKTEISELRADMGDLRTEMHQEFDDLKLQLNTVSNAVGEDLADHDRRIALLERRQAHA